MRPLNHRKSIYQHTNMSATSPKTVRKGNIVHHVPGRLRIKLIGSQASSEFYAGIEKAISSFHGVRRVRVNRHSSSIVINYVSPDSKFHLRLKEDPEIKSKLALIGSEALSEFILELDDQNEIYPKHHSRIAETVVSVAQRLDERLRQASNGYLDFKVLVPIGIAAATSLHKSRGKGTPMWLSLSTFAFNSFLTFHHHRINLPFVQIINLNKRKF